MMWVNVKVSSGWIFVLLSPQQMSLKISLRLRPVNAKAYFHGEYECVSQVRETMVVKLLHGMASLGSAMIQILLQTLLLTCRLQRVSWGIVLTGLFLLLMSGLVVGLYEQCSAQAVQHRPRGTRACLVGLFGRPGLAPSE